MNLIRHVSVLLTLAVLAALPLGCATPLVAVAEVDAPTQTWTDGNVMAGVANGSGSLYIRDKATGATIYGPLAITDGKWFVIRVRPKFHESYDPEQALPTFARDLFTQEEIQSLGLIFLGDQANQ